MDSTKVIVKVFSNSSRIMENLDANTWIYFGTILLLITTIISLAVIVTKIISCVHEHRMFMRSKTRVIVKTIYCNEDCRCREQSHKDNPELTAERQSSKVVNCPTKKAVLDGAVIINNNRFESNDQLDSNRKKSTTESDSNTGANSAAGDN